MLIRAKSAGKAYQIHQDAKVIFCYAFEHCDALVNISIPDNVVSIGVSTFEYCRNLESVDMPSVTSIGHRAFFGCGKLTEVDMPSVTDIAVDAFYNCDSLEKITIPDSITGVGLRAFYGCGKLQYNEYDNALYLGNSGNPYAVLISAKDTGITSCQIPSETNVIAGGAFEDCGKLTSITIPEGVKSLGDDVFKNCSSLMSITIPDGITRIGDSAFYNCSSLTSITIPDSVTEICDDAFLYCRRLTRVVIGKGVASIGNGAFDLCDMLEKVFYRGTAEDWEKTSVDRYDNHDLYSVTRFYYSETQPSESGRYWHYNINGYIVEWPRS